MQHSENFFSTQYLFQHHNALFMSIKDGLQEQFATFIEGSAQLCEKALFAVVEMNAPALLKILLAHGIDLDLKNNAQLTALELSILHGHIECTKLLLAHDAKTRIQLVLHNDRKLMMLYLFDAIIHNEYQWITELLDLEIDLNQADFLGNTALHLATHLNQTTIMQCLLSAKANPNVCNDEGLDPLDYAIKQENTDAVELLLDFGASIHARHIQMVCQLGLLSILKRMIRFNIQHLTIAFRYSARHGQLHCLTFLSQFHERLKLPRSMIDIATLEAQTMQQDNVLRYLQNNC